MDGLRSRREGLPAVDERVVAPQSRYEIIEGRLQYVPPADEPHASAHSRLQALLEAHVGADFQVACDMLTRTSETNDLAPDASVYPRARHPTTGGRQLEQLAFEVVSAQSLGDAAERARRLIGRGVRRFFAIDVGRARVLEWQPEASTWAIVPESSALEDPCLTPSLPVAALVGAGSLDEATARAMLIKRPAPIAEALERERDEGRSEGRSEGRVELLLELLTARFGPLSPAIEARVRAGSADALRRWSHAVLSAATLDDALG